MAKYINSKMKFEIDSTPTGPTPTYIAFTKVITAAPMSGNDKVDQTVYIGDDGFGSSNVIGKQDTIAFTGHYDGSDAASKIIMGMNNDIGDSRKRKFKVTYPDGATLAGEVTIANINIGEGNADELMGYSFEAHFNGKPVFTPAV